MVTDAIPIHNGGFVRLVDSMGDDSRVVQAARVSYGEGTKTMREDRALIRYLMRNDHNTPFEMVVFQFHIKCPIFIARQWLRHRTASVNEVSARYSELPEEYYLPKTWRTQGKNNKQGSGEPIEHGRGVDITESYNSTMDESFHQYKSALGVGVSREQARIVLPVSTYTEFYWQMNLHNLLHFLKLRLDHHAQEEIRDYAQAIAGIVKEAVPICYEAFEEYVLNGVRFSATEMGFIRTVAHPGATGYSFDPDVELSGGERQEFFAKIGVAND